MGVVAAAAVPVFQAEYELMRRGPFGSRHDVRIGGSRLAVADVVTDGTVQQGGILRHHRDVAAPGLLGGGGGVLAVDQDAAGGGGGGKQQQGHQGGVVR